MMRKLTEAYGIPSNLNRLLEEEFEEFVGEINDEMGDENLNKLVTEKDLIRRFIKEYGGSVWNELYYDGYRSVFKAIKALSVKDLCYEYKPSQQELEAGEIVNAITSVLLRTFANQHEADFANLAEEYNFVVTSNNEMRD